MRACGLDGLDDLEALDRFQVPNFLGQLAVPLGQHRNLVGARHGEVVLLQKPARALPRMGRASMSGMLGDMV
jgi:hypothetical protein